MDLRKTRMNNRDEKGELEAVVGCMLRILCLVFLSMAVAVTSILTISLYYFIPLL